MYVKLCMSTSVIPRMCSTYPIMNVVVCVVLQRTRNYYSFFGHLIIPLDPRSRALPCANARTSFCDILRRQLACSGPRGPKSVAGAQCAPISPRTPFFMRPGTREVGVASSQSPASRAPHPLPSPTVNPHRTAVDHRRSPSTTFDCPVQTSHSFHLILVHHTQNLNNPCAPGAPCSPPPALLALSLLSLLALPATLPATLPAATTLPATHDVVCPYIRTTSTDSPPSPQKFDFAKKHARIQPTSRRPLLPICSLPSDLFSSSDTPDHPFLSFTRLTCLHPRSLRHLARPPSCPALPLDWPRHSSATRIPLIVRRDTSCSSSPPTEATTPFFPPCLGCFSIFTYLLCATCLGNLSLKNIRSHQATSDKRQEEKKEQRHCSPHHRGTSRPRPHPSQYHQISLRSARS
jgi:hypothetical protein